MYLFQDIPNLIEMHSACNTIFFVSILFSKMLFKVTMYDSYMVTLKLGQQSSCVGSYALRDTEKITHAGYTKICQLLVVLLHDLKVKNFLRIVFEGIKNIYT